MMMRTTVDLMRMTVVMQSTDEMVMMPRRKSIRRGFGARKGGQGTLGQKGGGGEGKKGKRWSRGENGEKGKRWRGRNGEKMGMGRCWKREKVGGPDHSSVGAGEYRAALTGQPGDNLSSLPLSLIIISYIIFGPFLAIFAISAILDHLCYILPKWVQIGRNGPKLTKTAQEDFETISAGKFKKKLFLVIFSRVVWSFPFPPPEV